MALKQNSIKKKKKKKKTEELEKKIQNYKNEDKLKSIPKNKDNNKHFNMKSYARRLSKIHLSSTNWNINQLGDILTYPDVMEIEA